MKNLVNIYQLMTEKKAGIISASDEALLEAYMEEVPQVREMWEVIESGKQLTGNMPWRNTYSIVDPQEKKKSLQWGIAIGLILSLATAGWYLIHKSDSNIVFMHPINVSPAIALELADGSIRSLTDNTTAIYIGEQKLSLQPGTLSLESANNLPSGVNTLCIPNGNHYKVVLSDGSEIWVNSASQIQFPFAFNDGTREISLYGEAYFKIAANARQPFLLHLPNSTIQVLGTSFNVNAYDRNNICVSLTDGALRMMAGRQNVLLKPGQQAIYSENTRSFKVQPCEANEAAAWHRKQYYFSSVTLAGLKTVAFRRYGRHGVIDTFPAAQRVFTESNGGDKLPAGMLLPAPLHQDDSARLLQ
ncbi:FecR family protein [Chitinophaga sp. HK235]|uniref:FecR family protein n=1 Tax=Chitinophaga sp. HK235 TaxID=2952571 RepID=UPI00201377BD|nr:FecR domain-containing protein [Chitinophaga sp. HK235]